LRQRIPKLSVGAQVATSLTAGAQPKRGTLAGKFKGVGRETRCSEDTWGASTNGDNDRADRRKCTS